MIVKLYFCLRYFMYQMFSVPTFATYINDSLANYFWDGNNFGGLRKKQAKNFRDNLSFFTT